MSAPAGSTQHGCKLADTRARPWRTTGDKGTSKYWSRSCQIV